MKKFSLKHSFFFAIFISFSFAGNAQKQQSATRPESPNIIVILTDDAGYADFGFQSDKLIPTPNIDVLQQNGVTFTQAYATAPNCSPSRAGLLTSCYQQRFGHEYNLVKPKPAESISIDSLGLPLSQKIIPEYLKIEGYATAIIGKWHLGELPYFHPLKRGFDHFFGTLEGDSYYLTGQAKKIERNYKKIQPDSLPYLTDAFGDEAVSFIKKQKRPFFLYLAFNAPHVPLQAREDYLKLYRKQFVDVKRATNAAMIKSIDDNVGKILNVLQEKNMLENTLIVFTNDNGGEIFLNGSSNLPLKGLKRMLYEGGIRVPMIIHWPKYIKGKKVSETIVSTLDILPTIIAAAKLKPETKKKMDGKNLLPLLKYGQKLQNRSLYWRQGKIGAIRDGDWKLIYFNFKNCKPELYNIKSDINEIVDLSVKEPIVAGKLLKKYMKWQADLISPLWTGGPTDEEVLKMYDK
ncbi:sulfatase [Flavobacterium sp. MAHUQ-51]|uniref:sulfatase n=1 Tax=Flavobacterium sp. GCM10022190 TaxID=3252639 RepID=UPI0036192212